MIFEAFFDIPLKLIDRDVLVSSDMRACVAAYARGSLGTRLH